MTDFLAQRYPQISFLLQFYHNDHPITDENLSLKQLEHVQVLYLYGVETWHIVERCAFWLDESQERFIVLVEDDFNRVASYVNQRSENIFKNTKVFLKAVDSHKKLQMLAKECAETFPFGEIVCLFSKNKKLGKQFSEDLHIETTLTYYNHIEYFHYDQIIKRLLPNYLRMPQAFILNRLKKKFSNVAAIICGAGPSLSENISTLKTVKDHAAIFAGGSAIKTLTSQGVMPHFALEIDPTHLAKQVMQGSNLNDIPLLYDNRVNPDIFEHHKGPIGYIKRAHYSPFVDYLNEKLALEGDIFEGLDLRHFTGTTVSSLALVTAIYLGFSPIYLLGVDLAYKDNQEYAEKAPLKKVDKGYSQTQVDEMHLSKKNRLHKDVTTAIKWIMEAKWIDEIIEQKKIKVIDVSNHSVGFKNACVGSLSNIKSKPSVHLDKQIKKQINKAKSNIKAGQIHKLLEEVSQSLKRVIQLLTKWPDSDETQKLLLHFDLEEEIAYDIIAKPIWIEMIKTSSLYSQNPKDDVVESLMEKLQDLYDYMNKEVMAYV